MDAAEARARFAPTEPTGIWRLDAERELKRRAKIDLEGWKDDRVAEWFCDQSARDFWFWLRNFAWVLDPKRPTWKRVPLRTDWAFHADMYSLNLGLRPTDVLTVSNELVTHDNERLHRLAAAGDDLALRILRREVDRRADVGETILRNVICGASREVGKSVSLLNSALHPWLFEAGSHQIFISLKREKVDDNSLNFNRSLFGKLRCMIQWLPAWMRPPAWRSDKLPRTESRLMLLVNDANGAFISGQSTDPDAVRGERAKRVYVDEANSIPWLEELLEAVQHVGPATLVSSFKGMNTHYAKMWNGKVVPVHRYGAHVEVPGWVALRWHYSMRPDRDPETPSGRAWFARVRPDYSDPAWAQEMDLDMAASTPGRIWGEEFDETFHVVSPPEWNRDVVPYLGGATIVEGWDFGDSITGGALTVVVWAAHFESTNTVYVIDYRQWAGATAEQVARDVSRAKWRTIYSPDSPLPDYRVGDDAGNQRPRAMHGGRYLGATKSWFDNLKDEGIRIRGQRLRVEDAIEGVHRGLREARLFFGPRCAESRDDLPSLVESVSQYHRTGDSDPLAFIGNSNAPEKDVYSHAADALQHVCWKIWPRSRDAAHPVRHPS